MSAPLRLLALGAAVTLAACADFTSNENANANLPDVLVAHPSLATDLQPVFTARCGIGGCHTVAENRANGLILTPGYTYGSTVGVESKYNPPMERVTPGDHADSWLWLVVQGDSLLHPGIPRMPLAAQPLTANMIQNIANWIDDGAPNN